MSYLLMATALAEDLRARGLANIELGEAEAIVARMLDRTSDLARRLTRERELPVAPGQLMACHRPEER